MALIKKFEKKPPTRNSIHDGIDASYMIFKDGDASFIQIDSYGRTSRQIPGKKSQVIQLDRKSGKQLFEILKEAFDFK